MEEEGGRVAVTWRAVDSNCEGYNVANKAAALSKVVRKFLGLRKLRVNHTTDHLPLPHYRQMDDEVDGTR